MKKKGNGIKGLNGSSPAEKRKVTMVKKIYTVTDFGPGDGGKGGVVHKIATMMRAHTILKVGGAQGSHGVSTSSGENFAFSQWGCGTFEGIRTHISSRMIVLPEGLLNEANALRYEHGIYDPFGLLTVDREALCATPYHGIASRLKEMAHGSNPRGTIGTGVGEAFRDFQRFPEIAIRVSDLSQPDIRDRIASVREQIIRDLTPIIQGKFLSEDQDSVNKEVDLLFDDGFLDYNANLFGEVAKKAKIVDHEYLEREILSRDGVVVVESSHGVLTDHFHGFHPHTSAIRTLPCFTHDMLREAGYDGEIVNIAVHRAYEVRHGAGPMPTANPEMTEKLLPGSHKEENRYQGKIRTGPIDLVLLRYAVEVCGGPNAFQGLAITWFDQIQANGKWHLCNRYLNATDQSFFSPEGEIKIRYGSDSDQLNHQEALGKQLLGCIPEITTLEIQPDADKDRLYSLCADVLHEKLGLKVRMLSLGPTERDKICK